MDSTVADGRGLPEIGLAGAPVYGKDEELTRVRSRASPEVEGRHGGRVTVVGNRRWWRSVEAMLEHGERRIEVGRGAVMSGVVLAFYRGRGSAGEGWPGVNTGVNGFNTIEDGGGGSEGN
jgi:hypothetical protein